MIFDNPITRKKRPFSGGGTGDEEQDIEEIKKPDSEQIEDSLDQAIQEAFLATGGGCDCKSCGPMMNCPDHPGCDGGSGEDLRNRNRRKL